MCIVSGEGALPSSPANTTPTTMVMWGYVTHFQNFGTPLISRDRLKLETWHRDGRHVSSNEKLQNQIKRDTWGPLNDLKLRQYALYLRKCASSDSASFFWFFRQPTAKTPAPIFTINTSNDAVSRKDVRFGGSENKILHFDPIFSPKSQIFGQFSTGLKISRQEGLNNGDARL